MDKNVAGLHEKLRTATGRDRVDTLNALAWELRTSDLARLRQLSSDARELAAQLNYPAGIACSLATLARADQYEGHSDLALRKVLEALAMMDQHQVQGEPRLDALATLAMIYMTIDDYANVVETGRDLLRLAQEAAHVDYQISALNTLAAAYSHTGNYQQALNHYALAFPLCKITGNRQMEGVMYVNEMIEYAALGDYQSALKVGQEGLEILYEVNIPDLIVSCLNRIGETYAQMGDHLTALSYFHNAYERAQSLEVNAQKQTSYVAYNLGKTNLAQKNLTTAETYLKEALAIAEESRLRHIVYLSHECLAELYEDSNPRQALEHYREFHRVKEEIFNEKNAEKINLLMILHQTELLESLRENDRRYFERMNRMKDELIQSTSHDLKNPLTVMTTTLDLMQRKQPLPREEWQRYSERLQIQIERMRNLIANLLDLAALEAQSPNLQPVSITHLIRETVEDFEASMAHKHIEMTFQDMAGDLYVAMDEQHLQRILQNLLSNALKYTPEKGRISLKVNADPSLVRILVQDTGIGIPEHDQPFIFEKFYRVKNPAHAVIEGSGLGLSIVKKIVERYQGSVRVESHPGEGSLFEVTLPLWKAG